MMYLLKVFVLIIFTNILSAQNNNDKDWDDWSEEESSWQFTSSLELNYGQRLQTDSNFASKATLEDFRFQLESEFQAENYQFNFKADILNDGVINSVEKDIRELNIGFTLLENFDIKVGRQISTWGTGDLVFLNDLFPKDWQSFLSGREDNYLKSPATTLKINSYFDLVNIDIVWTPKFTPDRYINGERFSLFNPVANNFIGGSELINTEIPSESLSDGSLSLRLHKNFQSDEFALYYHQGFSQQPMALTSQFESQFYRKNVYGASYRSSQKIGLLNAELALHKSKNDSNGSNPLIPNSQFRLLLGLERELIPRLNWSTQLYYEKTLSYDNLLNNSITPEFEVDNHRKVITQRFTYKILNEKINCSLFAFYSPSDNDSYIRPSVSFRKNDHWNYTLGANLFNGEKEHTFFGQFENATNAYFRLKYFFNN